MLEPWAHSSLGGLDPTTGALWIVAGFRLRDILCRLTDNRVSRLLQAPVSPL